MHLKVYSIFQSQPKYIKTNNVYCSQGDQPLWNISVKPKTLLVHQIYRTDYQCVVSYQPFSLIAFGCNWARRPLTQFYIQLVYRATSSFTFTFKKLSFSIQMASQMPQTVKFMESNVTYKTTVYKTGSCTRIQEERKEKLFRPACHSSKDVGKVLGFSQYLIFAKQLEN